MYGRTILSLRDGNNNEYGPLEDCDWIKEGTLAMSDHGLCRFHLVVHSHINNPQGQPSAKGQPEFKIVSEEQIKEMDLQLDVGR